MKGNYLEIVLLALVAVVAVQGYYLYDMNRTVKDEHVYPQVAETLLIPEVPSFSGFFNAGGESFVEMESLRHKMERNFMDFENFFQTTPSFNKFSSRLYRMPRFDMKEQDGKYIVTMEIPGIDKNAIDIKTENGRLVVSANVSQEKDNNTTTYYRHERHSSSYKRAIQLPADTNKRSFNSEYKNGLLTITFEKTIP